MPSEKPHARRSRTRSLSSASSLASSGGSSTTTSYSTSRSASSRSRSPRPATPSRNRPVGPALPPDLRRPARDGRDRSEAREFKRTEDDDDGEIGPAPPSGQHPDREDGVSAATREFLEREQRRNEARIMAELAAQGAATTRPEWMLALPTASSSLSSIAADPTRLKSRGFSQTAARVQKRGIGGVSDGPQDSSLWTESPEERAQRLQDEVTGKRSRPGVDLPNEDDRLQRLAQKRRDDTIQTQLRNDTARSTSLLDLHKEKRKEELRDKERSRDKPRSRDRDARSSAIEQSDSNDSRRRKRSGRAQSHRNHSRSRSPSSRKGSERHRGSSSERHQSRRHEQDDGVSEHRKHRSSRSEHGNRGGTKGTDGDEEEEARRRRRKRRTERELERERRREKDRRRGGKTKHEDEDDDDDKAERTKGKKSRKSSASTSAPVMWDRDAAMSVGGKLMDEKSRSRMVHDAAALGSRFGNGSSRFL